MDFHGRSHLQLQKRVIDGGRTGEILCLGVIKNPSGLQSRFLCHLNFIAIQGEELKFVKFCRA